MITLFHGSGALDFEIVSTHLTGADWQTVMDAAICYLQEKNQVEAADILRSHSFELSDGTNGFGDEFLVLHVTIPMAEYVKLSGTIFDRKKAVIFEHIANALHEIGYWPRFIAAYADISQSVSVVPNPTPQFTTTTVERALRDAQILLRSSGASSAVDRVHTAIHGYLEKICDDSKIVYPKNANVDELFNLIRNHHPKFKPTGAHDPSILAILRASTKTFDAINTLRNTASVAHPNPVLLNEPEAILMINTGRTLLHYLDAKLK